MAIATFDFSGTTTVVTGGASGIGTTAIQLARALGARVEVLDSDLVRTRRALGRRRVVSGRQRCPRHEALEEERAELALNLGMLFDTSRRTSGWIDSMSWPSWYLMKTAAVEGTEDSPIALLSGRTTWTRATMTPSIWESVMPCSAIRCVKLARNFFQSGLPRIVRMAFGPVAASRRAASAAERPCGELLAAA